MTAGKQNAGFFSKDQENFHTISLEEATSYMMSYHERTGKMPFTSAWIVTNKTLNGNKVCVVWDSYGHGVVVREFRPDLQADNIGGLPLAGEFSQTLES